MKILLMSSSAALTVIALLCPPGSLYLWICITALACISIITFGKFFSFFLVSCLLSFSYIDLSHESAWYSLALPLYTWIALIVLLINLYFKFPEYLGQKVNRPGGSFWDSFGDGDF